jgi:transcriptional regulator with XRE-family HTH domain
MQNDKLDNYLRTYRKKLGLTQREVAFVLGCHGGAKVSRYERSGCIPDFKTNFAYEAMKPPKEHSSRRYEVNPNLAENGCKCCAALLIADVRSPINRSNPDKILNGTVTFI